MNKFKVGDLITFNVEGVTPQFCIIKEIKYNEYLDDNELYGYWTYTVENALVANKNLTPNNGYIREKNAILVSKKENKIIPYGISKFIDEVNGGRYVKK